MQVKRDVCFTTTVPSSHTGVFKATEVKTLDFFIQKMRNHTWFILPNSLHGVQKSAVQI